ncbi:MAG: hypothetical protein K5910_01245 [Bacteroidales bacterium]|nr:hypothetical protein [Bacteroidales bacterium]
MKSRLTHLFLALVLSLSTLAAYGQGKVYTRKVRLEDFPTRTTKVVLEGNSFLELALREEVSIHWRISPYEFCDPQEYARLRTSNNFYFLNLATEEGIAYLILTKGGKEDEKESLKKPFEVVRIPLASSDAPSGRELMLMGAFLDILQNFVEEAMISDKAAYGGLSAGKSNQLKGKKIYLDPDAADEVFLNGEPGALIAVSIAPEQIDFSTVCYKMLISADTHELFYYERSRYKGPRDAKFSDSEIQRFDRRGAIIVRPGGN